MPRIKYSDIADRIDVDRFEEAIDFEPLETTSKGEDRGYCPDLFGMHKNGDTTGKFSINREKRVFNCWVCGGGSLLSLVMALYDHWSEQEALDWLYQFCRPSDQSDDDFMSEIGDLLATKPKDGNTMPYFNENVLLKWAKTHHPWFAERGISVEVEESHRLGFNEKAKRLSSKGIYEGSAIILPHFWNGRLVGWQERWLGDRPPWLPKYTNTGNFPRSNTLFGYEDTYLSDKPIVVVESIPTVLFLKSIGIPAIATFGSSVTDEQLRLLRGCQQGLYLAPDNDAPGHKFYANLKDSLERYIPLGSMGFVDGEGNDLGDLVDNPEDVRTRYEAAKYVISEDI